MVPVYLTRSKISRKNTDLKNFDSVWDPKGDRQNSPKDLPIFAATMVKAELTRRVVVNQVIASS